MFTLARPGPSMMNSEFVNRHGAIMMGSEFADQQGSSLTPIKKNFKKIRNCPYFNDQLRLQAKAEISRKSQEFNKKCRFQQK